MCNTGTRQCGQRRVRERMHRAPVCAHGCSPLSAPPLSLLRLPLARFPSRPSGAHIPSVLPSPSAFLPPLRAVLSRRFLLFISLIPLYVPVFLTLSLSLSVSPFFSIPTYLSIYYQLSLSTGSSSFSSFVLHQSFSLSRSLHLPFTHRDARARMYARSLMDNRSIFFSLFPLCFSFVPSILLLLFLLLLFLLLLRMSSI